MEYSHNQYGEVFADIYDEWYHDLDPIPDVVRFVGQLANCTAILELGVGTGRLALPLAQSGLHVVGIDSSPAMLAALAAKPDGNLVDARLGHMVRDMPNEKYGVILIAYNTLFNLLHEPEQYECLLQAAHRLLPGGHIIVDCFVPDDHLPTAVARHIVRTSQTSTVHSEASIDQSQQRMHGSLGDSNTADNQRNWSVRYATVGQIDAMALTAGLVLKQRWASYGRAPFNEESVRHISVYSITPLSLD